MQNADKQPGRFSSSASAGLVFGNGGAAELIRHGGNLKFLIWDGHDYKIADQFIYERVTYNLPDIHPCVAPFLALPTGIADFGSTRQLYNRIVEVVSPAIVGNVALADPLTFGIMASWRCDFCPAAPFIWVVTSATSNISALKELLGQLCRHGLVLNLLASGWTSTVPMALQPTLIAEVDSPSRRLLSELRASQTHGAYPVRGSRLIDPFCPKVVFARTPIEHPEAAGFPIEIVLGPEGDPISYPHPPPIVLEELRNQLLAYRLTNCSKLVSPSFVLNHLSAPVRAMAHSFAAAVVNDDDLQARIVPYVLPLESDIQADPTMTDKRLVLEVIRTHWTEEEVGIAEITADVNTLISGRGGTRQLSPEQVGWRLKGMGIARRNSNGSMVLHIPEVRPAIVKVGAACGVTFPEPTVHSGNDMP